MRAQCGALRSLGGPRSAQGWGSLTGSCRLLRTEEHSLLAPETPSPSAARRDVEAGRPPGILGKGKQLIKEGCGWDSSSKDGGPCSTGALLASSALITF